MRGYRGRRTKKEEDKMSRSLAYKNLKGKPGRSLMLTALSFFLSFCILAGSLILSGLESGLGSLDARLGADVMVVPYKAATENYLQDTILMGNDGYYYMSSEKMDEIAGKVDGIEKMSPQLFVASTTSSCCSYKVSIVGFDPETDFTIQPWVQNSYSGELKDNEIFVGHDLNAYAGDSLSFFGVEVTVAARLDRTGTYLDTAVYTNMDTARALLAAAREKGLLQNSGKDVDLTVIISCIMIKAEDGYDAEWIEGRIKSLVRQVATVKTATSVEDVSNKLNGIRNIAAVLIAAVWILIFIVEMIAFRMSYASRTREFAVLRIAGASKKQLSRLVRKEALLVSLAGSVTGTAAAMLVITLFAGQIENTLGMPFLLPRAGVTLLLWGACAAVSIAGGVLAASSAAGRAGRTDAAVILRGEN